MACGILLDARVEHETDSRLRSGIPSAAGRSDAGEENSIVSRQTKFENRQLLDWYGHYLPTETFGYADALSDGAKRLYPAPAERAVAGRGRRLPKSRTPAKGCVAPRGGIEPPTRRLEGEALSASMV